MDEKFSADLARAADELLKGAIELHLHSAPSIFERRADDTLVLAEASAAGMRALVLKNHEVETAARVQLLPEGGPGQARAYGSIVLNHPVGGINPAAAEVSLKLGGRMVWLPTISAKQHIGYFKKQGKSFLGTALKYGSDEGITVFDDSGRLIPAMADIFDLVNSEEAVLCSGHLSLQETLAAASAFLKPGHRGSFVFTHPDLSITRSPLEEQLKVAEMGGLIEKCILTTHPAWGGVSIEEFARSIKVIGAERCFLSTDAGGTDRPSSPETFKTFIPELLKAGITMKEIRIMVSEVPAMLLGI